MPNSDTVERFKDFNRGQVYRERIIPSLAAVKLADASFVNAMADAETRQEKKRLANNLSLVRDVDEPLEDYISRTNSKTCQKAVPLLGKEEVDDRSIKPLYHVSEPITFEVHHAIPVKGSIAHKSATYNARLTIHKAVALQATIIDSEPMCSHEKEEPLPDFDGWEKRLVSRLSGVSAEVKEKRFYSLLTSFSLPTSFEFSDPRFDIGPSPFACVYKNSLSEDYSCITTYNVEFVRITLGFRGITMRQLGGKVVGAKKEYSVPECGQELFGNLHFDTYDTDGRVNSDCLRQLLANPSFLRSYNAYHFTAQIYLKIINRDSVVKDFIERPPQYPTLPENVGLKIVRDNIYDDYPTKVFFYTKLDGRRCAAAFGGALGAESLRKLHELLMFVDFCDCYEIW